MEILFIRVVDGNPVDHPILESNLLQVFGKIDSETFKPFVRVQQPPVGILEVNEGVTYELVDGAYRDVWNVRPMTEEEKQAKVKELYGIRPHASWSVDTNTGQYVPPTPYPEDGNRYIWNEETLSWDIFVPVDEPIGGAV